MASLTYLDTHVVVWLYLARLDLLSPAALEAVESDELLVSPMVELELEYLREVGRLRVGAREILQALHDALGLGLCDLDFRRVVAEALGHDWTRDPFDRIIAAHATLAARPLLTRDETLRAHCRQARW